MLSRIVAKQLSWAEELSKIHKHNSSYKHAPKLALPPHPPARVASIIDAVLKELGRFFLPAMRSAKMVVRDGDEALAQSYGRLEVLTRL